MRYLVNAFSLNMLPHLEVGEHAALSVLRLRGPEEAAAVLGPESCWRSAVGHEDTACVFECLLGVDVPVQRVNIDLRLGNSLVVGQYSGPRLPEGATSLPEGAKIDWFLVRR